MATAMCACATKQQATAGITEHENTDIPATEATETAAMPHDDAQSFATALFKTVNSNSSEENLCISPASAMWAIAMTANGAENGTAEQKTAPQSRCTPRLDTPQRQSSAQPSTHYRKAALKPPKRTRRLL